MSDFVTRNWLWLTLLVLITPLVTAIGLMWLRAWQLSLGAWMKGVHVGITDLLMMQVRRIDTTLLVNQLLVAKQNGLQIEAEPLATHHLAGGNIRVVLAALLSAKRFGIPLTLERACAVDLVGQDPLKLIADAVHEAGKIPAPVFDGTGNPTQAQVNPATILLQATPGTAGTITGAPRLTARVRFPQGELDVVVHSQRVPAAGDKVRVTIVDGVTITVEPALA